MKRKTSAAAALIAVMSCPLAAHAQSVTIIGEGTSGAARNTTGASAYKNTIRQEDPGATTVNAGAIPSSAGRSDGTSVGANTGSTGGGGSTGAGGTAGSTGSNAGAAAPAAGAGGGGAGGGGGGAGGGGGGTGGGGGGGGR